MLEADSFSWSYYNAINQIRFMTIFILSKLDGRNLLLTLHANQAINVALFFFYSLQSRLETTATTITEKEIFRNIL